MEASDTAWLTLSREILDTLPHGVLLVDLKCRVLASNRAAGAVLRERDPLELDGEGRLRGVEFVIAAELEGLMERVASEESGCAATSLRRRHGGRALQVVVRGLRTEPPDARLVLVVVAGVDRCPEPAPHVLRQLYRLTPTEARVASCLIAGLRSEEVGHHLRIGANTVRTHLKSIFAKTGARSQSDLVRILLCGPVWTAMYGSEETRRGSEPGSGSSRG